MLTHSGHGSVTGSSIKHNPGQSCVSTLCEGRDQEDHWLCCSGSLGKEQLDTAAVCKQCDHPAGSPESQERHSTRCANGGQRHCMHACLVALIVIILLLAGVPKSSIVPEKKVSGLTTGHALVTLSC